MTQNESQPTPGRIRGFEDLVAWQKAMDLVVCVYEMTKGFPADERFGLVSQLRRAAVSVPSNIAEGHGRVQRRDYIRFLDMARGSANEVKTQVLLAGRLGLAASPVAESALRLVDEVQRILKGLITALRRKA